MENTKRRLEAGQALVARELKLAAGEVVDLEAMGRQASAGTLVLGGFLSREVTIANRVSADLVGPEDLLRATGTDPGDGLFRYEMSWVALIPTRLALLDRAFCERAASWPEVAWALVERARRPGDRAALGRAIARAPAIDSRLLMSMWHWASSWSSVTSEGVRLSVPLSHERLGRLIGASRPTVTSAISRLRGAGYLRQRQDRTWMLLDPEGDGTVEPRGGADEGGVELPSLGGLALKGRPKDPGAALRRDLNVRLAEQRELLRTAAARHAEQLERLRDHSDELRATTERSARTRRELQRSAGSTRNSDATDPEASA